MPHEKKDILRDEAGMLVDGLLVEVARPSGAIDLTRRKTRSQRVRERDGGWCTVPGCSRPAAHAHHIEVRSHRGGDEDENQGATCPPHHLHGIHKGYVRVRGQAPDRLEWELGEED